MSGYITIKLRRGTASQWTSSNPILADGEVGLETDTRKFKVGNGTGQWTSLSYWGSAGGGASAFVDLTDVPASYSGQGGKGVRVKADASGLEFYSLTIAAGDLPTGIDAAKIADGSVSNAEFQYLNGVTSAIQTQLDGKQPTGNYYDKSSDDADDITAGATNKFATQGEKDKLSNITITQPVDLDAIESRVNELDAAVILKGTWDASTGVFAGGGVAQAGWSYIVSLAGTVDGVSFSVNDRLIAITDNASTSTFTNNWFKADYTDLVTSVDGATGAVTVGAIIAAASTKDAIADTDLFGMADSESSNATKKTAWSNIKSKLNTYFSNIYQTLREIVNGSISAVNDKNYIVVSSSTFTDPTPVEGKGYTVFVRNGTATIGGIGYSTAGRLYYRIYHSGAWATYDLGLGSKQDTLVSGTNIKTVNGNSLLGSGDLTISGGGGSYVVGEKFSNVEDYIKGSLPDEFQTFNSGTGSGFSYANFEGHPGNIYPGPGTASGATSGYAYATFQGMQTTGFCVASGDVRFGGVFKMPATLFNATEDYELIFGSNASNFGYSNYSVRVLARYSANSGKLYFEYYTTSAQVTIVANTAGALVADTWYSFEATISGTNHDCEFFVNGVSEGTGTPASKITSGQLTGWGWHGIRKHASAGAHPRPYIDVTFFEQTLNR